MSIAIVSYDRLISDRIEVPWRNKSDRGILYQVLPNSDVL